MYFGKILVYSILSAITLAGAVVNCEDPSKKEPGKKEDKWPAKWCDKQCTETKIFANACKKSKKMTIDCICSSHFAEKLGKCRGDGCGQHYKNSHWPSQIEPLLEDCSSGRYHEGPL
ncbi:BA75_03425T0 [Komagataella pastoris]|uniref:BA75_03425T0 n=1 Tax=Komagataella pastoris TaxID=4922 RepID=A0A1B2JG69_PICPA|nr:BA75_03425T0 [Komagataella pastoris]